MTHERLDINSPTPILTGPDAPDRERVRAVDVGGVGSKGADEWSEDPSLVGRRASLRPVFPADYDWLYEISCSPAIGYRWRNRGATPSPEAFVESLWRGVLAQFMIERNDDREAIGNVFAYNADLRNGHASVGVMVNPDVSGRGWGLEGAGLFVDYVFKVWNLRKIYAEAPGFNFEQFRSGAGRLFREEGLLRNHDYYDGRYWDLHILAIDRSDWQTLAAKWRIRRDTRGVGHTAGVST